MGDQGDSDGVALQVVLMLVEEKTPVSLRSATVVYVSGWGVGCE
jgi:hypothetical protein